MPDTSFFRPHVMGRRWGFTHYNLVFPDLPAPHLFMACAVMIGQTGTRAFDDDAAVGNDPRDTATVAIGTAATAPGWFRSYSVERECELNENGDHLQFGHEVTISGTFPEISLLVSREGFTAQLQLRVSHDVTWFARSPLYQHVGLPARYEGTISWAGQNHRVQGVCSFEYARASSLTVFTGRPAPTLVKFPMNFFTYQVMAIDAENLLLLTHVRAMGRPVLTTAHTTGLGEDRSHSGHGVCFDRSRRGTTRAAPDGTRTRVPEQFRWTGVLGARPGVHSGDGTRHRDDLRHRPRLDRGSALHRTLRRRRGGGPGIRGVHRPALPNEWPLGAGERSVTTLLEGLP